MSYDDDFNPADALLGGKGPTDHRRQSTFRPRRQPRSAYDSAPKPAANRGIYDHLGMVFRDAPCFIPQGAPLLAKLLQERVESEDALVKHMVTGKRRSDALIQDLVEYMIRRFWERDPNDQRGNPLNTFFSAEWWEPLVEESVDHQRTVRIPDTAWRPDGAHVVNESDPFYSPFFAAQKAHPAGTLMERMQAAREKQHTTTEEDK